VTRRFRLGVLMILALAGVCLLAPVMAAAYEGPPQPTLPPAPTPRPSPKPSPSPAPKPSSGGGSAGAGKTDTGHAGSGKGSGGGSGASPKSSGSGPGGSGGGGPAPEQAPPVEPPPPPIAADAGALGRLVIEMRRWADLVRAMPVAAPPVDLRPAVAAAFSTGPADIDVAALVVPAVDVLHRERDRGSGSGP